MTEQWLDIRGWEGFYQVSNHGRVRRMPSAVPLQGKINKYGYRLFTLSRPGVPRKEKFAHLLVLEHFVGERPARHYGCHNDGVPLNCHVDNLRWDTMKANQADRIRHGTDQFGERNACAKLTEAAVVEIRACSGRAKELAEKFGVTPSLISHIRARRAWRHI